MIFYLFVWLTLNKEIIMTIIVMAVAKIIIETIYIFTEDRKQISLFATDQVKKKTSAEPG